MQGISHLENDFLNNNSLNKCKNKYKTGISKITFNITCFLYFTLYTTNYENCSSYSSQEIFLHQSNVYADFLMIIPNEIVKMY